MRASPAHGLSRVSALMESRLPRIYDGLFHKIANKPERASVFGESSACQDAHELAHPSSGRRNE